MTTSRGFDTNDYHNRMSFHNLDQTERRPRRLSPIRLRSDDIEYPTYRTRNDDRPHTPESKQSTCCSKQCLIGLCIGLLIGIVLVIAIAVPIGVTKTCPTNEPTISVTPSCPSTTTSTPRSCIGVISPTPNWTGTFLMDSGCVVTSCCCLSNQIIVNQTASNTMLITGNVVGQCANVGSMVSLPITPFPTNFQIIFLWGQIPIRLQLGQDSSYLSFVNILNAICSATALRRS